jgi:TIR domain
MNVFLSWSGARSRAIAQALYDWLPTIIQDVKPWMSENDIEKGTRGLQVIGGQLEATQFGIICLTPENLTAPWLLFEAGALSKSQDESRVWTLLYQLEHSEVTGPLAQFQHTKAEKEDVRKLMRAINTAQGETLITEAQLAKAFDRGWGELDEQLQKIPKARTGGAPERTQLDMIKEILEHVRDLARKPTSEAGALERAIRKLERASGGDSELKRMAGLSPENPQGISPAVAAMLFGVALGHHSKIHEHRSLKIGDKVFDETYGYGKVTSKEEAVFGVKFDGTGFFTSYRYGEPQLKVVSE